jgi:hypothetical protein
MKTSKVIARFNFDELSDICRRPTHSFSEFGEKRGDGKTLHFFKDNGSKVLAVAHLDSVQAGKEFCALVNFPQGPRVYSPSLDDRLGAYTILKYLPALGIKTDILLTDNEESGNSTAEFFKTEKKYNWMFMFDRRGDDVVLYQYESPELRKYLTKAGFRIGSGSFSCIRKLEDLGCKGFNVGCGYEDYHGPYAYTNLKDYWAQVQRFTTFYWQNKDRKMSHTKVTYPAYTNYQGSYQSGWPERKHHYYPQGQCYQEDLWTERSRVGAVQPSATEDDCYVFDTKKNSGWHLAGSIVDTDPKQHEKKDSSDASLALRPFLSDDELSDMIMRVGERAFFECPRCHETETWSAVMVNEICPRCRQPLYALFH